MRLAFTQIYTLLFCTCSVVFGAPIGAAPEPLITLDVHDAPIADVLTLLGADGGTNIVTDSSVKAEHVTLHLHNVPFDEAVGIILRAYGLQAQRTNNVLLVGVQTASSPKTSRVQTQVYTLHYERATDILKLLKGVVPTDDAAADDMENAIIVTGNDQIQRRAIGFLKQADIASPQVLLEVRVADVEPINDSSDFGLEFGGADLQGNPLAGAATYSFSTPTVSVNARLNALTTEGRAHILATPKLLTLNNHEASLLIGETYPITYQTSAFSGQAVQFIDIGVKLRLTPTIGPDGSVTAELHPEYSEIEGYTSDNLPIVANRKIDSTLRVQSDQTIVLGGLLRDVDSTTITKIPGLSSIPVLGKFFQDKATQRQRNEIVFLITPHVIYPGQTPPSK